LARQLADVKESLSHDESFSSLFGGNQEWMRSDELQDVVEMLDVLAQEVRRMMREDDYATLMTVGITVSDASVEELYESRKRVRVIVRDAYFGQVGTLISQ
jgi:hypothetical protein